MKTLNELLNFLKYKKTEEFLNADKAYQEATYQDTLTRDQFKEQLINSLKKRIKNDIKVDRAHLDITTYSGYREKQVLPEVADFFRDLSYKVDLLNGKGYEDINVLIINWQGLETSFK